MGKHSSLDLKQTTNQITPTSEYVRLLSHADGSLRYIMPNGEVRNISSPWELPTTEYTTTDPSALTPNQWQMYLVPLGSIGDWAGHDQDIAQWNGTGWEFITPKKGSTTYLLSDNNIYNFDGNTWVPISAIPTIEDITYDDLYAKINSSSLVIGKKYRITDFCSTNVVDTRHIIGPPNDIYTSPSFMLLTQAVSNNELELSVVDLNNIFDEVYYDPEMTVPVYFWAEKNLTNGTIDSEYVSFGNRNEIVSDEYAPFCEVTFIDEFNVKLGTATKIDPVTTRVTVGDSGNNTVLFMSDSRISFDDVTGILTLTGGPTFFGNVLQNTYTIYVQDDIYMFSPERRYGVIIWRNDLRYSVKADLDWKNVHYRVYNTTLNNTTAVPVHDYYSLNHNDFRVQNPSIFTDTNVADVDYNDYILKPMFNNVTFTSIKNLTLSGCRGIVFENYDTIQNVEIINSNNLFFWRDPNGGGQPLSNFKFIDSDSSSILNSLSGTEIKPSIIRVRESLLVGNVSNSNLEILASQITNISDSDISDITAFRMDDNAIIKNCTGNSLGSSTMLVNTAPQCLMQNSKFYDISRSYFEDCEIDKLDCVGVQTFQLAHFESTITNLKLIFTLAGYAHNVYFTNDVTNTELTGVFENITFPEIIDSELTGNITTNITKIINNNFINCDAAYTMPAIGLGVYLDSSVSSFDIELPDDPVINQELIFIDSVGACDTNNVNIIISGSPAVGVVNTINGTTSRIIDQKYGILSLRYGDTVGWVVVQETVVNDDIYVDNLTIEETTLLKIKSSGNDFLTDINKYWISGNNTPYPATINTAFYGDGALFGKNIQDIFSISSATPIVFPPGTYEFYSTADFSSDGPMLEDDASATYPFDPNPVEEFGFYRYSVTLAASANILSFYCAGGSTLIEPIWFIDRFSTALVPEITIKNIDSIIDANDTSIDGSGREATEPKKELVTKSYVDKIIGTVDDITLERSYSEIPISNINDVNLLLHDTWSDEIANTGWSLNADATISNGRISIPAGSVMPVVGDYDVMSCTDTGAFTKYRVYKFKIINKEGWFSVRGQSLSNGGIVKVVCREYENIGGGWELGSILLPPDFSPIAICVDTGSTSFSGDYALEPVVMDQYPPEFNSKIKEIDHIIDDDNESIDGSNTPMVDSHRELVTRAYIDKISANSVGVDDITIEEGWQKSAIATNADLQLVTEEAWGNSQPITNWTLDSQVTYNGLGQFNISGLATTLMTTTTSVSSPSPNTGFYRFYINWDIIATGNDLILHFDDGSTLGITTQTALLNGWYLLDFDLSLTNGSQGAVVEIAPVSQFGSGAKILEFVKEDEYPGPSVHTIKEINYIIGNDDKSIDGTSITSSNWEKELVTKRKIDLMIPKDDGKTIDIKNLDQKLLNWYDNFREQWGFTGYSATTLTAGTYADGVFTADVSNHLELTLAVSGLQTGIYIFVIDENIPVGNVTWTVDGVAMTPSYSLSRYIFEYTATDIGLKNVNISIDGATQFNLTFTAVKDSITIKEIDYIIDDDNESIDGSDTPMSDPHRELITRAYFNVHAGAVEDVTYDELNILIDGNAVISGKFYRITDYQTLNWLSPHRQDLHSSGVMPLIVQGASQDSIYSSVIDTVNTTDIVEYSIANKENIFHAYHLMNGMSTYTLRNEESVDIVLNPPAIANSVDAGGTNWTLGTDVIVDMSTLVVETYGGNGNIPNSDMSWDPVTGVLSIISGSRTFDETRIIMGQPGGSGITAGVKRVDPVKPYGEIIYRTDPFKSIEGDFDWRNHHYYRYSTDTSVVPVWNIGTVDLMARGSYSINIGPSGSGLPLSYKTLTSTSTKNIYPAIDPSLDYNNIKMKNVTFTTIFADSMKNVEFTNINESLFYCDINPINDCKFNNMQDFYSYNSGGYKDSSIDFGTNVLIMNGNFQTCYFKKLQNQTLCQSSQNINMNCEINNTNFNHDIIQWSSVDAFVLSNCYFEYGLDRVRMTAQNITGLFEGRFSNNNINITGDFNVNCSGNFEYNDINAGRFDSVVVSGDFSYNYVTASWSCVNVANVTQSKIDTNTVFPWSNPLTESDDIINSAIAIKSTKVCNSYSMTYVIDSTGGSFDIELPEEPIQNTRLVFVDELGNTATNNINIIASTSPAVGIINTINGNSVDPLYVLGKDYSYVEIIYTDDGGWILMKESQATLTVDDITVESPTNVITIKNIDYIIDDDNESIDGSDTPMVDAHRELTTRAYVDDNLSNIELLLFLKTIDATDIANKYIEIGTTPLIKYEVNIKGAPYQYVIDDYVRDPVNQNRITWDGLGLDGVIRVGHKVAIYYTN